MLTIIHGENLVKSREKLWQLKQLATDKGQKIETLNAKKIKPAQLEIALTGADLFGQSQLLVIETLHSLAHSKKRTAYFTQINQASEDLDIILWEKKLLSKSNLKKFPRALEFSYKMGKALWQLIDQLSPRPNSKKQQLLTLHRAIDEDSAEFSLSMITKRIRELIAIKIGADEGIHPFVKSKLRQQEKNFTLERLLTLHQELYQLDAKLKQSLNLLKLAGQLDLFLINL